MGARRTKLIEARERQGLRRKELSIRLGITHQFVMRVEEGERGPSIQTMARWADALGISMDDFREDAEPQSQSAA